MEIYILIGGLMSFLIGLNNKNIWFTTALLIALVNLILYDFNNHVQCDSTITILSIFLDIALFSIGFIINLKLKKE